MNQTHKIGILTSMLLSSLTFSLSGQSYKVDNYSKKINAPIPLYVSAERGVKTIQFDSAIDRRFDSTTGQWADNHRMYHTYHPNGELHTKVTYFLNEKNIQTSNSQGQIILYERFELDSGSWLPLQQSDYYYNQNNQLIEILGNVFAQGQWIALSSYQLAYHANGEISEELYKSKNGSTWENTNQYFYSYDSNNNIDTITAYTFVNGVQTKNSLISQDFDSNSNLIRKENYFGVSNVWQPNSKQENQYNASNLLENQVFYTGSAMNWVRTDSMNFVYNVSNNVSNSDGYQFINGVWEPSFWDSYTYNSNNDETNFLRQIYVAGVLENGFQRINEYNSDFIKTLFSMSNWNSSTSSWDHQIKYEYSQIYYSIPSVTTVYRGSGNTWVLDKSEERMFDYDITEDEIQGYPFSGIWDYKWESLMTYENVNGIWTQTVFHQNYYSDLINSTKEVTSSQVQLFPNPATTQMQIITNSERPVQAEFLNITGHKVKELNYSGTSQTVDISTLENGSYLLRITQEGKSITKKFIKY